ncbi:MAG TPA: hypothetical protein VMY76_13360 [Gemmatimonadales bacterium]|nr:hypothetical protein [Gemmatimonadales bacterium]
MLREAGLNDPRRVELEDLGRLPLLDRHVIARHGLDAFLIDGAEGLFPVVTSGSTGTPGRFLRSRAEESDYSARWWRVYRAYGCGMRDPQVNVATAQKRDRSGPIARLRQLGVLPRVERLDAHAPPEHVVQRIKAVHPPMLTGYAGAIEALAEHVVATGAQLPQPRAVFCTAMEVTEHCLEVTEAAFSAPAVEVYVTNEFGVIAWACPIRRGLLHVNDDAFILEVVDPEGRPVPPGELGEVVVTSLSLYAMPLIRYRMGDMARRVAERCACGRGLGLMTRVQGRTAHAIRRSNGAVITTPVITSMLGRARADEWVRGFQVREEGARSLRFLLDVSRRPSDEQRIVLRDTVHAAIGDEFRIAFEDVDGIPSAPNGKRQFLVPYDKR